MILGSELHGLELYRGILPAITVFGFNRMWVEFGFSTEALDFSDEPTRDFGRWRGLSCYSTNINDYNGFY